MNTINLAPVLDPIIQVAAVVLLGLVVPALNKFAAFFAARTHVILSNQALDAVRGAVNTAATMLQTAALKAVDKSAVLHVNSADMAVAVNHVLSSVPDALARLGVTPATLANKILTTVIADPFFDGAPRADIGAQTPAAPFTPPMPVPVATIGATS